MPLPYQEGPEDEFDPEVDFEEAADGSQPGDGVSLSATAQDATRIGYVPWNKLRSAARYFLGFSHADEGAPYKLHREPPDRHPKFPGLYAHSINLTGLGLASNAENPDGEPYETSPFTGVDGQTLWNVLYEKAQVVIRYRSFGRMRFLADADIDNHLDEYKRYVTYGVDPAVEALTADGSSLLKFREGAPSGIPFPAPVAELMAKAAIVLNWHQVPHEYLSSDPDINLMDKILGRQNTVSSSVPCLLGSVNSTPFLGFAKGTLLLKAVKAEEVLYPVAALDPFDVIGGYNVQLVWEFFDPAKGTTSSEYRGHRLFPYRFDGKWYHANREDNTNELLPLRDHWKVFQHAQDPS